MRAAILLIAAIALAGCAGKASAPTAAATVQLQCLPMVDYPQDALDRFAKEAASLDAAKHGQVIRFLGDYAAMRAANRACKNGRP